MSISRAVMGSFKARTINAHRGSKVRTLRFYVDVPSPINPPRGCRFHTRCPYMIEACKQIVPPLVEVKPAHFAACIRISPEQPDIDRVAPGDAPGLAAAQQATEQTMLRI